MTNGYFGGDAGMRHVVLREASSHVRNVMITLNTSVEHVIDGSMGNDFIGNNGSLNNGHGVSQCYAMLSVKIANEA